MGPYSDGTYMGRQYVGFSINYHDVAFHMHKDPFWIIKAMGGEVRECPNSLNVQIVIPIPASKPYRNEVTVEQPKKPKKDISKILSYYLQPRRKIINNEKTQ